MDRDELLPTEREWLIMDAVWDSEDQPTSSEILGRIDEAAKLDARTERVLLHHLCRKGLLGYVVDEHDSRVYHYYPLRTREECLREKSRDFVDTYFQGICGGGAAQKRSVYRRTAQRAGGDPEIPEGRRERMSFWSYCAPLRLVFSMIDFCAVYFMTLLGRCAIFSLPLLAFILLLRWVLRRSTFAKGAIWAAMLPVLLVGRLSVYYSGSRLYLPLLLWPKYLPTRLMQRLSLLN